MHFFHIQHVTLSLYEVFPKFRSNFAERFPTKLQTEKIHQNIK